MHEYFFIAHAWLCLSRHLITQWAQLAVAKQTRKTKATVSALFKSTRKLCRINQDVRVSRDYIVQIVITANLIKLEEVCKNFLFRLISEIKAYDGAHEIGYGPSNLPIHTDHTYNQFQAAVSFFPKYAGAKLNALSARDVQSFPPVCESECVNIHAV